MDDAYTYSASNNVQNLFDLGINTITGVTINLTPAPSTTVLIRN